MISETTRAMGRLQIELRDEHGALKAERDIPNLVTTAGKNHMAARMVTSGLPAAMGWMEVGTNSTAAAAGDVLLGAYVVGSRTAVTSATPSTNTVTYVCTFGAGIGTGALTEVGVFNVVTQNTATLLCRSVFTVINKAAGDSMTVTWVITIA